MTSALTGAGGRPSGPRGGLVRRPFLTQHKQTALFFIHTPETLLSVSFAQKAVSIDPPFPPDAVRLRPD